MADAAYSNCTFKDSKLIVDGRPVQSVGNHYENCVVEFVGPAAVAVGIITEFCKMSPEMAMQFAKTIGIVTENKH